MCDVKAKKRLPHPVTLAQVKARADLKDWDLVRLGRLSVVPVSEKQFKVLMEMAEGT